jgi:MoaA/NifB/PqqE/SkfB family radical SAM enzyme
MKRLRGESALHRALGGLASMARKLRPGPGPEAELETLLARLPKTAPVTLAGHDVLEYAGILGLMEMVKKSGRRVRIISPGLKLSDRAFCERMAVYRPEITVTYLTHSADSYARLTGNPDAKGQVEHAMRNMIELGVFFRVNFVALSENIDDLVPVAGTLFDEAGLDTLSLLTLFPGPAQAVLDDRLHDRFARFYRIDVQLARFASIHRGSDVKISLWGVPPCKLSEDVLCSPNVAFATGNPADAPKFRHRECPRCRFEPHCSFVSRYYHDRYPEEPFDAGKVNRLFGRLTF